MHWQELTTRQPRLAELARDRLIGPGVVLVATVRRDGTPRVSPVEPWLMAGDLWLSMLWGSLKAVDLERDPRVLVHSIVTGRDGAEGEVKLRGRADRSDDPAVQRRYAGEVGAALGWSPEPGRFHLFRVDLAELTVIRYDETTGDQYLLRWPAGVEQVRRGTSATSLGAPAPLSEILLPEPPSR